MLKDWNSFINESTSYEDLVEDIKFAFLDLIDSKVVNIFIENDKLEYLILQTMFIQESSSINSKLFFKNYDKTQEQIQDIRIAILRLKDQGIICDIKYTNVGLNFEMKFYSSNKELGSFYSKRGNLVSISESKLKDSLLIKEKVGFDILEKTNGIYLKLIFNSDREMLRSVFPLINTRTNELGLIIDFLKIEKNNPLVIKLVKYTTEYPFYILVEINPKYTYELID